MTERMQCNRDYSFFDRKEGLQEVKDKVKPFDWTFTTPYEGTLLSRENAFKVICYFCSSV